MRKMSARWVPRLLTPDNKRNRETTSEQCLTLSRNPKEFEVFSRVITGERLELGPNKPLAQGTRLGYVITGYLNKETSFDKSNQNQS